MLHPFHYRKGYQRNLDISDIEGASPKRVVSGERSVSGLTAQKIGFGSKAPALLNKRNLSVAKPKFEDLRLTGKGKTIDVNQYSTNKKAVASKKANGQPSG